MTPLKICLMVWMMIGEGAGGMNTREQDYLKLGKWVERLQANKNDQEAFEALYSSVLPHLMFTARMLCNHKEQDALDLVQQTLLQFYAKVDIIGQPRTVLKWLNTTMRRLKKDEVQKLSNVNEILVDDKGDGLFGTLQETARAALPAEQTDAAETQRLVREMITTLPEEQQQTLIFRYVEELSISEIAELMGCPVPTVKSRLRYAENAVREQTLTLERKGTKLYTVTMPMLYLILRELLRAKGAISAEAAKSLLAGVQTAIGVSASGAAATAATTAAHSGGTAVIGSAATTKAVAGIVAAALLIGGGAAWRHTSKPNQEAFAPSGTQQVVGTSEEPPAFSLDDTETRIALNRFLSDISQGELWYYDHETGAVDYINFVYRLLSFRQSPDIRQSENVNAVSENAAQKLAQQYFNRSIPEQPSPMGVWELRNGEYIAEDGYFGEDRWLGAADQLVQNSDGTYTVGVITFYEFTYNTDLYEGYENKSLLSDKEALYPLTADELIMRLGDGLDFYYKEARVGVREAPADDQAFFLIELRDSAFETRMNS